MAGLKIVAYLSCSAGCTHFAWTKIRKLYLTSRGSDPSMYVIWIRDITPVTSTAQFMSVDSQHFLTMFNVISRAWSIHKLLQRLILVFLFLEVTRNVNTYHVPTKYVFMSLSSLSTKSLNQVSLQSISTKYLYQVSNHCQRSLWLL